MPHSDPLYVNINVRKPDGRDTASGFRIKPDSNGHVQFYILTPEGDRLLALTVEARATRDGYRYIAAFDQTVESHPRVFYIGYGPEDAIK